MQQKSQFCNFLEKFPNLDLPSNQSNMLFYSQDILVFDIRFFFINVNVTTNPCDNEINNVQVTYNKTMHSIKK